MTVGILACDKGTVRAESVYSVARAISGTPLRDSYHLGSTIVNDYGRPYANGFNNYSGGSGFASAGRFLLYLRGEFQGAPSTAGYPSALVRNLQPSTARATISTPPVGDLESHAPLCRTISRRRCRRGPSRRPHEVASWKPMSPPSFSTMSFSFGKQDDWQGPGQGGAMSYSNNAENIYSFRINRIEPLEVPLLSRITGPFRYEFLVGPLKGHTYPIDPWVMWKKSALDQRLILSSVSNAP